MQPQQCISQLLFLLHMLLQDLSAELGELREMLAQQHVANTQVKNELAQCKKM
jgi:hypothetical protein